MVHHTSTNSHTHTCTSVNATPSQCGCSSESLLLLYNKRAIRIESVLFVHSVNERTNDRTSGMGEHKNERAADDFWPISKRCLFCHFQTHSYSGPWVYVCASYILWLQTYVTLKSNEFYYKMKKWIYIFFFFISCFSHSCAHDQVCARSIAHRFNSECCQ